jgi:hypothetical protein
MWFRVFGTSEVAPEPAAILERLHGLGLKAEGHFHGDEQGWFEVDFVLPDLPEPLRLERFLSSEEDIRDQLNAWAAWLETAADNPHYGRLMQQVISTQQVFTLQCPRHRLEEPPVERFCTELSRYLASRTRGVYQVDGRGFFAPSGELLVGE